MRLHRVCVCVCVWWVCMRVRVSMCRMSMWHKLGTCCAKTCLCYAIRLTPAPVYLSVRSALAEHSPRSRRSLQLGLKISIEYKHRNTRSLVNSMTKTKQWQNKRLPLSCHSFCTLLPILTDYSWYNTIYRSLVSMVAIRYIAQIPPVCVSTAPVQDLCSWWSRSGQIFGQN